MKIKLHNVRLSFPSLFRKATFEGKETKYEGTFLLNKEEHAEVVKKLQAAIKDMIRDDFKGQKISADRICLKDGDEIGRDGYEGTWSIKAGNNTRPVTVDRSKNPVTEDDDVFYAGCYVNAIIEFWAQNNGFGKRINANLLGVQFYKEGQPFASGEKASQDDFDMFEDEEDDGDIPF